MNLNSLILQSLPTYFFWIRHCQHQIMAKAMVAVYGDEHMTEHHASTFADLGVCPELVDACDALGWKQPTKIQVEAIPYALKGIALSYFAYSSTIRGAYVDRNQDCGLLIWI